jgi:Tfp pilus assembly protein PilW
MLSALRKLPRRAGRQHGFTLVETLVALVTGLVVSMALFAILEVSSRQTSRISEVSQATNIGRAAMAHVVDELHSACLSSGFRPVKTGSTESKLIFVSGYFPEKANEKTEPEYGFVRKNQIELSGGKLVEEKWKASGEESAGEYPWTSLGKTTIAANISQSEESKEAKPVFTYYEYGTSFTTGSSEAAQTLTNMKLAKAAALTAEQASKVAAVEVSFRTEPYKREYKFGGNSESGTNLSQTTLTTFNLGAPNSETKIEAKPCE